MALKQYKPRTPGTRQLVLVDRTGLHKGGPVKSLTEGLMKPMAEGLSPAEILAVADRLGASFIATGHYARIARDGAGAPKAGAKIISSDKMDGTTAKIRYLADDGMSFNSEMTGTTGGGGAGAGSA